MRLLQAARREQAKDRFSGFLYAMHASCRTLYLSFSLWKHAVGIGTTFLLRPFDTSTALLAFRPKNRLQFLTGERPYKAYCDADLYMNRGGLRCSKHQIQPKTLFETRDVRLPVSGLWGKMLASIGIERIISEGQSGLGRSVDTEHVRAMDSVFYEAWHFRLFDLFGGVQNGLAWISFVLV